VLVVWVLHRQLQALASPIRGAVVAVLVLVTQAAQAELGAVAMVALTQVLMAHLAQQTRVVVLVAIDMPQVPQAMAVLV
jgi:hypothetical protein